MHCIETTQRVIKQFVPQKNLSRHNLVFLRQTLWSTLITSKEVIRVDQSHSYSIKRV